MHGEGAFRTARLCVEARGGGQSVGADEQPVSLSEAGDWGRRRNDAYISVSL